MNYDINHARGMVQTMWYPSTIACPYLISILYALHIGWLRDTCWLLLLSSECVSPVSWEVDVLLCFSRSFFFYIHSSKIENMKRTKHKKNLKFPPLVSTDTFPMHCTFRISIIQYILSNSHGLYHTNHSLL